MKNSTWYYKVGFLLMIGGLMLQLIVKGMVGTVLGVPFVFMGAMLGKRAAQFYNLEHGRNEDHGFGQPKEAAPSVHGPFIFMLLFILLLWFIDTH